MLTSLFSRKSAIASAQALSQRNFCMMTRPSSNVTRAVLTQIDQRYFSKGEDKVEEKVEPVVVDLEEQQEIHKMNITRNAPKLLWTAGMLTYWFNGGAALWYFLAFTFYPSMLFTMHGLKVMSARGFFKDSGFGLMSNGEKVHAALCDAKNGDDIAFMW